jgi:hypothetical protein
MSPVVVVRAPISPHGYVSSGSLAFRDFVVSNSLHELGVTFPPEVACNTPLVT